MKTHPRRSLAFARSALAAASALLATFAAHAAGAPDPGDYAPAPPGTTHVARAEEWPIMPTEWVNVLLKPWNFFNETPTLGLAKPAK